MDAELESRVREYLHGSPDAAAREQLAERLKRDPKALSEFVDQLQVHQRLRVVAAENAPDAVTAAVLREIEFLDDAPRFSRSVVEQVKRLPAPAHRAMRSWLLGAAVASFLAVLGVVLFVPSERPFGGPVAAAVSPGVLVEREGKPIPLGRGMSLLEGDSLRVPEGGLLVLRYGATSRVELGPGGASLSKAGAGHVLHLARGSLGAAVSAAEGGPTLSFSTPHGTLAGSGSWLTLEAAPGFSRLEVEDGSATFTRRSDGARVEVRGGHEARIEEGRPPEARPVRRAALLVVGAIPAGAGDASVRARLVRLGFDVTLKAAKEVTPSDARGKAFVAISSTSLAEDVIEAVGELRNKFRDLPVPVLTWEPRLLFDLGMIAGSAHKRDWAATRGRWILRVAEAAHPLAAGLSGPVRVTRGPDQLSWGRAPAGAIRVATIEGESARDAIFAFERGAAMPGRAAPARRVGFFLFDETAAALTDEGWALFDAAVRWCGKAGAP
jgi:hypothetical protein